MIKLIKETPKLKEKYQIITSIQGAGHKFAITVLTEMPDVENFETSQQFAAFAGVVPSHHQSGSSILGKSHISKKGSPSIRKMGYMAALWIKNKNQHFSTWVKKLSQKGKSAKMIIIAVLRKLFAIVFGMLKYKTKFNPSLAFKA